MDHAVCRRWCPYCVNGRAESWGHVQRAPGEGETPVIGVDYTYMRSEQEKEEEEEEEKEEEEEEEKGMPMVVTKDNKTKMIMAKVVPSTGFVDYAVEFAKKTVEAMGYKNSFTA